MNQRPLCAVAHVGVTVPDLELAIQWYQDLLGFQLFFGPVEVIADDSAIGCQVRDVFGHGLESFRQAHLLSDNGVALEMFEFIKPPVQSAVRPLEYWRIGLFHLCVVVPDIEQRAAAIVASGGKRTSEIWQIFADDEPTFCYCEDPFGNVIELYSHSHERAFANRGGYR